jgi:hypothetical protein
MLVAFFPLRPTAPRLVGLAGRDPHPDEVPEPLGSGGTFVGAVACPPTQMDALGHRFPPSCARPGARYPPGSGARTHH